MPPIRRRAALGLLAAPALAAAGFPDRPVRLLVPFTPGGNADTVARILAPRLAESLGQPVVVENRGGAGGNVGAAAVARGRPDGYGLLLGSNGPLTVNPAIQPALPYDALRDFAPIGLACRTPNCLIVTRGLPAPDLAGFLALARAAPGQVTVASSGVGAVSHLAIAMLGAAAGVSLQHVPYASGGSMAPDLIAGTVAAAMTEVSTALPLHREGQGRILGLAAAARLPAAPELPTLEEQGVPVRAAAFLGLLAPAAVPEEAMRPLAAAFAATVADPGVRRRLEETGSAMASAEEATPAGFARFLLEETAWTRAAAERAGLRPGG